MIILDAGDRVHVPVLKMEDWVLGNLVVGFAGMAFGIKFFLRREGFATGYRSLRNHHSREHRLSTMMVMVIDEMTMIVRLMLPIAM